MRSRFSTLPIAAAALLVLSGCAADPGASATTPPAPEDTQQTQTPEPDAGASTAEPGSDAACEYLAGGASARAGISPPGDPVLEGDVTARIITSSGEIPLELTASRTPCTVASFASLAEQGYFDDTECHRLTTQGIFVLQCGDPSSTGSGGPGYRFADELDGSETYPAGTLAMANAGPDTNGSQFFLVYEDSTLPPSYTVFGRLSGDGLDVVRQIAAEGTANAQADGPPAAGVEIQSVVVGE